MNLHKKLSVIPVQERAYIGGTIECIGDEWIFIDEVNEVASDLSELGQDLEVQIDGNWVKGTLIENTLFYIENGYFYLSNGDKVRAKKNLTYAFKQLIDELSVESYLQFVNTLNSLSYSLYDCMYCHNFLSFLEKSKEKEGMNVMVFDNEVQICVVQHFFYRGENITAVQDRFEFALNDGKRVICSYLNK